jgi:hypothetical protein
MIIKIEGQGSGYLGIEGRRKAPEGRVGSAESPEFVIE